MTNAQIRKQRRIRRVKRQRYMARLLFFSAIILLGLLGCIYIDTACSKNMSYSYSTETTQPSKGNVIKQDWQYEIELEKSEIMKYSMQ